MAFAGGWRRGSATSLLLQAGQPIRGRLPFHCSLSFSPPLRSSPVPRRLAMRINKLGWCSNPGPHCCSARDLGQRQKKKKIRTACRAVTPQGQTRGQAGPGRARHHRPNVKFARGTVFARRGVWQHYRRGAGVSRRAAGRPRECPLPGSEYASVLIGVVARMARRGGPEAGPGRAQGRGRRGRQAGPAFRLRLGAWRGLAAWQSLAERGTLKDAAQALEEDGARAPAPRRCCWRGLLAFAQ